MLGVGVDSMFKSQDQPQNTEWKEEVSEFGTAVNYQGNGLATKSPRGAV